MLKLKTESNTGWSDTLTRDPTRTGQTGCPEDSVPSLPPLPPPLQLLRHYSSSTLMFGKSHHL